jgi:predicted nucleic acid-binding protein
VGEAALRRGAAVLPEGGRRDRLIAEIDAMIAEDIAGRVPPFDSAAAMAFAGIFVDRRRAGRPISVPDCQIAATARAHRAALATRIVADFEGCGVAVIDPCADSGGA